MATLWSALSFSAKKSTKGVLPEPPAVMLPTEIILILDLYDRKGKVLYKNLRKIATKQKTNENG
jgi:hypothetical protein